MASTTTLPRHRGPANGQRRWQSIRWPWRHQPETPATPDPDPDQPDWHKAYGRTHDEKGNEVPNYKNWARCTCEIGCDHLVN